MQVPTVVMSRCSDQFDKAKCVLWGTGHGNPGSMQPQRVLQPTNSGVGGSSGGTVAAPCSCSTMDYKQLCAFIGRCAPSSQATLQPGHRTGGGCAPPHIRTPGWRTGPRGLNNTQPTPTPPPLPGAQRLGRGGRGAALGQRAGPGVPGPPCWICAAARRRHHYLLAHQRGAGLLHEVVGGVRAAAGEMLRRKGMLAVVSAQPAGEHHERWLCALHHRLAPSPCACAWCRQLSTLRAVNKHFDRSAPEIVAGWGFTRELAEEVLRCGAARPARARRCACCPASPLDHHPLLLLPADRSRWAPLCCALGPNRGSWCSA